MGGGGTLITQNPTSSECRSCLAKYYVIFRIFFFSCRGVNPKSSANVVLVDACSIEVYRVLAKVFSERREGGGGTLAQNRRNAVLVDACPIEVYRFLAKVVSERREGGGGTLAQNRRNAILVWQNIGDIIYYFSYMPGRATVFVHRGCLSGLLTKHFFGGVWIWSSPSG